MKTVGELLAWCDGAKEELGDASLATEQIFVSFKQVFSTPTGVSGTCAFCGCTENAPCAGGCSWIDPEQTVCSAEPLTISYARDELILGFFENFPRLKIDVVGPRLSDDLVDSSLEAFGIEEITPGLWALTPSLNVPGLVHVFVVVYDVPTPAPWERRII